MGLLMVLATRTRNEGTPPPPDEEPAWDVNDGLVLGELPVKVKGVNFAPTFPEVVYSTEILFDDWDYYFPTYLVPLIDTAVADLGVNCFRLIGSPLSILQGGHTYEEYFRKYGELIEYCRTKNCYVEATAGAWQNMLTVGGGYASNAEVKPYLVEFAKWAQTFPNVIGIDLIQEFNGFYMSGQRAESEVVTLITETIAECKAEGVTKPLTFSVQPWDTYDNIFGLAWWDTLAPLVDYLCPHIYYPITNMADMDPLVTFGKPIFWGETGVMRPGHGELSYSGGRNAHINQLQNHIEDPNLTGFQWWCMNDEGDFFWGLYNAALTPYSQADVDDFFAIPIPVIG